MKRVSEAAEEMDEEKIRSKKVKVPNSEQELEGDASPMKPDIVSVVTPVPEEWTGNIESQLRSGEGQPYTFTSTAKILEFIQTFSNHPCTPLVTRSVYFCNRRKDRGFTEAVDDFMVQFGHQVRYLRIGRYDLEPWQLYRRLHLALTKAPGLKHLRFDGEELHWEVDDETLAWNTMCAYFLKRPLPFIPTLESLWFNVMYCSPQFQSMVMLPYATQLRSLSMNMCAWQNYFARGLINLQELVLLDIFSNDMLRKLLEINSPIEKISLSFGGRISLALVMEVLGKFPLRDEVTLRFGAEGWVDQPEEGEIPAAALAGIRLPKVTKLYISQRNKFAYNFLKCFPNLESLTVQVEGYLGGDNQEMEPETEKDVQLYRIIEEKGGLYESNIWRKIPKLKSVHIFDSTFDEERGVPYKLFDVRGSREEYERFRSQEWSQLCMMLAQ